MRLSVLPKSAGANFKGRCLLLYALITQPISHAIFPTSRDVFLSKAATLIGFFLRRSPPAAHPST